MDRMAEVRDQSVEELKTIYLDLSRELFNMKNEISTTGKIDKPHRVRAAKRKRARVLTLLNEKGAKVAYGR